MTELRDTTSSFALQVFSCSSFGNIRIVMRDDQPWFVAKDVAACIDHKDVSTMCRMCRDKDLYVASASGFDTVCLEGSGNSRITLISESGLYRILAKSSLPKCEPFESWIFDEVLPSIRKTGEYGVAPPLNMSEESIPSIVVTCPQQITHKVKQVMINGLFDKCSSVSSSTEIHVYGSYTEAPQISGVYIFEIEKNLVKCGMSRNVRKRFTQLVKIKKHREAVLNCRVAILPVDREKLKKAETAFFSLLGGRIDGTDLFKMPFSRALKVMRRLYESNPSSMFHLTDAEKLEMESCVENGFVTWLCKTLDVIRVKEDYARKRVTGETFISKVFSELLETFPKSVDRISFERIKNEYRHYIGLIRSVLDPRLTEQYYGRYVLDDITVERIRALALRLYSVTFSYKAVLDSPISPRVMVYHVANLMFVLGDIKNLSSELSDEGACREFSNRCASVFKEICEIADYFFRYLLTRLILTVDKGEGDGTQFNKDNLRFIGKKLHEMLNEEDRVTDKNQYFKVAKERIEAMQKALEMQKQEQIEQQEEQKQTQNDYDEQEVEFTDETLAAIDEIDAMFDHSDDVD